MCIYVAPYVGAWIETLLKVNNWLSDGSHPMWVRGLKLAICIPFRFIARSHPMWVRGLKHSVGINLREQVGSHPMWVRGLKPFRGSACL